MTFYQIEQARDTAANWTTNNPVLGIGEIGWETDTGKSKRGDGVTTWTSLGYVVDTTAIHQTGNETKSGNLTLTGAFTVADKTSATNVALRPRVRRFYVDATNGNDGNDGQSGGSAFATIAGTLSTLGANPGLIRLLPGGSHQISTLVNIPHQVDLRGELSAQGGGATKIVCTAAGAGVTFGTAAQVATGVSASTSSGHSGGFSIDGGGVATNPLYVGIRVGMRLANVDVFNSASGGINWLLEGTQNCVFEEINLQSGGGVGFRIDKGAYNNYFLECEFGGAHDALMDFTATSAPPGLLASTGNNVFEGCRVEYDTATTPALLSYRAGQGNMFSDCFFVTQLNSTKILVDMSTVVGGAQPILLIRDAVFQFNTVLTDTMAFKIDLSSKVEASGINTITGANWGRKFLNASPFGTAWEEAGTTVFNSVAIPDSAPNAPAHTLDIFLQGHRRSQMVVTKGVTGDLVESSMVDGDTVVRWRRNVDGAMEWGPGSGGIDASLYRGAAGTLSVGGELTVSGKVRATGGLGVGNAVAATTPGSVVAKIQVFDATGASLGYLPVYSTIT